MTRGLHHSGLFFRKYQLTGLLLKKRNLKLSRSITFAPLKNAKFKS
jgi:hypothetical protein